MSPTPAWRRRTGLSGYPDDHIGRPAGTARASPGTGISGALGPRRAPTWSWSQDETTLGGNDFRSAKAGILSAEVRDAGGCGVRVLSDGSQSVRTWLEGGSVRLLVADYSNGGFEQYFRPHLEKDFRLLVAGAEVAGGATLELLPPATIGAR